MNRSAPLLALLAIVGTGTTAAAQVNILSTATLPLDAGAPSARSLAMGGAFIGLADDATTTVTNPAGLRLLGRREIAAEFRTSEADMISALRGRRFGSPTGIGVDTVGSIEIGVERQRVALLPTFAAFAFPSSRWAAGFYWHHLAGPDFEITSRSEGLFVTGPGGIVERLRSQQARSALASDVFGGAMSISITRRLSVGVGFQLTKLEMSGSTMEGTPPSTFAPAIFDQSDGPFVVASFLTNETLPATTIGVSWTPVPEVQIGVVHRRGVRGTMRVSTRLQGSVSLLGETQTGPLAMPDRTGAGVAVRLGQGRLAMDAVHIRYSNLSRNFVDAFAPLSGTSEASFYRYPDVFEVHAGGEYLFTVGQAALAARAGWWHDPAHEVVYGGANLAEASRFPLEDRGKHHLTAGAGVLVGRLEFDIGFDRSSSSRILSLGLIARF